MFIFGKMWYNEKTMEFISISKKHSFWSGVAHISLNILLILSAWVSIFVTKTPYLAVGLVLISKWRTFAVRPRYWIVNIKSNLVDLIFSLGVVILMWSTGVENPFSQIFLLAIYSTWLLWLKPKSSEIMMKAQSLLAVFFGMTAFLSVSYSWDLLFVAIFGFFIGYATLRHAISSSDTENSEMISLFWGMIFAEFSWVLSNMVIGYNVSIGEFFNLMIPQASIILTTISFLAFEVLYSDKKKEKNLQDFYVPAGFVVAVCLILLIFFSTIPVK